jgi:drug/metabolite transporter (DMT)-like permease
MIDYVFLLVCAFLGALAQIFLKDGIVAFSISQWWQPKLIYGLGLYGFAMLLYLWVLKRVSVSVAYPFIALSYIFVAMLASYWLGEPFTGIKLAGCLFIIVGVGLISL